VLLKLRAVAPQGVMKLKSGGHEIFKHAKKIIFYIIDPLKKLNKLVKKLWYRFTSGEVPHRFVATANFWVSLQY
jgi:hypothetical protein